MSDHEIYDTYRGGRFGSFVALNRKYSPQVDMKFFF